MAEPAVDMEVAAAAVEAGTESPASSEKRPRADAGAEVVSVELPAPAGWKKKFTPKKGGTPRRNEIIFIAPTGEEIKSKRQLDLYLKSHLGGPSSSEFDWGTGDTPRRSARISERAKATESPEGEPPKKRGRKPGPRKGKKEEKESDGEEEPSVEAEDTKASGDAEMKESEDDGAEKAKEDAATGEAGGIAGKSDNQEKTEEIVEGKDKNNEEVADGKIDEEEPQSEKLEEFDKEKIPGQIADGKVKEGGESQGDKVEEAAVSQPQTEKVEEDGKAQTTREESNPQKENAEDQEKSEIPQKEIRPGEVLPEKDDYKGGEDGAKAMEVHSIKPEDTQQQPSAVNC